MFKEAPPLARICEFARVFSHAMLRKETDFHALFLGVRESLNLSDEVINDIILALLSRLKTLLKVLNWNSIKRETFWNSLKRQIRLSVEFRKKSPPIRTPYRNTHFRHLRQ